MTRRITCLAITVAALLLAITSFLSVVHAQGFSLFPAEVNIANLSPGQEAEFDFTICNKDDVSHIFSLTVFNPDESERREGRTAFPDSTWISFSPRQVELQANSEAQARVAIDIPPDDKWTGGNWEVWLGVTPESSDLLTVQLYLRLLVSTGEAGKGRSSTWLIVVIVVAVALIGYGVYYFWWKTRQSSP